MPCENENCKNNKQMNILLIGVIILASIAANQFIIGLQNTKDDGFINECVAWQNMGFSVMSGDCNYNQHWKNPMTNETIKSSCVWFINATDDSFVSEIYKKNETTLLSRDIALCSKYIKSKYLYGFQGLNQYSTKR